MTAPVTVGVFGGTFDPMHYGHVHAISAALQVLDYVHVFPSHEHPYRKLPFLPYEVRMKLVEQTVKEVFETDPKTRGRVVVQSLKNWKVWGLISSEATIHILEKYKREKFYSRNTSHRTPYLVLGSDISNDEIRDRWVEGARVVSFPILRIDRDEIVKLRGFDAHDGFENTTIEHSSTRVRLALRERDFATVRELVFAAKETIDAWENQAALLALEADQTA